MSKELEALEVLKCGYKDEKKVCITRSCFDKNIGIIENALKEKENIEKTINELFSENGKVITTIDIKKQLKALKIIKEKRVDVCYFMNCKTLEEYNDDVLGSYAYEKDDAEQRKLTQEEFDLLEEVLL